MFMLSFRLTKGKVLAGMLALAVVAVVGYTGVNMARNKSVDTLGAAEEVVEQKSSKKAGGDAAKTPEERLAFVTAFGWEVAGEPAEIQEVIIPKEFDEVYLEYNSIQKRQGYDLEKYAGKRCKRYSYVITNYPQAQGEVRFNLLVYKDKVVGGDVCSLELDGFMHGFSLEG